MTGRWRMETDHDGVSALIDARPGSSGRGCCLVDPMGHPLLGTDVVAACAAEANDLHGRLKAAVQSYEAKVQDLAAETRRAGALTAEVARLTAERLEFKRSVTVVVGMHETTRRERDAALAEVARLRAAIDKVRSGVGPLRQHARLVRSDPAERTYADGVNAACDLVEADLAAVLGGAS